jgi:hypothetical protein
VRDLLWKWRVHNRFALAWWAFCNPDNLTMLRHELEVFARTRARASLRWAHVGVRLDGS